MTERRDAVLTKAEAQAYLRISRATLDRLIAAQTLPIIKLGRRVLIRRDTLEQVLRAHERPATPLVPRPEAEGTHEQEAP